MIAQIRKSKGKGSQGSLRSTPDDRHNITGTSPSILTLIALKQKCLPELPVRR